MPLARLRGSFLVGAFALLTLVGALALAVRGAASQAPPLAMEQLRTSGLTTYRLGA